MDITEAVEINGFMEKYNSHFDDTLMFLMKKQQKVLDDDLIWLHDSLSEEQRLSMMGNSLENKRLEMLERMGYPEAKSSALLEVFPEECRGKLKLECERLEKTIARIKAVNAEILETVEKKMDILEEYIKAQGLDKGPARSAKFYDPTGGKIRIGDPDDNIIGEM